MVLVVPHDTKSSWKRATRSATRGSDDVDETLIRSNSQSTTPNKEEFTPEQQETFLSDLFYPHIIEFIDTEQRSTKEDDMLKKRKSRILDDDEFREAYGFVRRNSMTQARTRILTRQAKIESIEYPSDSTSYTSGDLLADGDANHVAATTTNRSRPFDTWSHRSSSGLGSESEELTDHQHSIDHSGFIHHKIARRTFALVFALAAENVLYLYDGPNSETTLDVICLHSYRTKPGANTGSRFKFKLEQRDCETHHFYVDNICDMTRWMAIFEQSYQRKSISEQPEENMINTPKKPVLPVPEFLNINQDNTLIMGLSPKHHQSSGEKVKITEAYRKKQEAIASESHQKMTRLAQRRHSTCQKMNRLKRQNSGHENEQRRHGLKQQLNEINEEMHKTFIQSKENLGRIAAEKEKELRSLSSTELTSFDADSDEDYPSLIALKLDEENEEAKKEKKRSQSRLSGLLDLPRKLASKRSLSRSKSSGPELDKKSMSIVSSHDERHTIVVDSPRPHNHPTLSSKCRQENLQRLKNRPILDELEKFDQFCSAFSRKLNTTDQQQTSLTSEHGARITMAESLI